MCRPVNGSCEEVCPGGHIGPPLRGTGAFRSNGNRCETEPFPSGAGRSPPPTGGAEQDGVGWARSPRPTGATQVVPGGGPMYLGHGFRRPNFVPKFGASVMGIGPYAPRGTRDGTPGRRALRVVAESRRDCPGQRRTAERLRQRVRGNEWELRQRSSPKGSSTSDNPSVALRATAPFTQGSLWERGMRIAASLRSSQ